MVEKKCSVCGFTKDLSEYYKHPKMADGHLNKCKECQKANSRAARDRNPDHYREYDKARANQPERVKARREYIRTDAGRLAKARATKNYQERYPMKRAAHTIVSNAIRDDKLKKPGAYESCGSNHKIEAHHDNYTKPLDVRWLCEECHKEWHRTNEPIYS